MRRFQVYVALGASLLLAACGDSGGGGGSCTLMDVSGEPDLTGPPQFSVTSATKNDVVTLSVPIDADTAYISVWMVSSLEQSNIFLYKVLEEAVTPGEQIWQANINLSNYQASNYFADIEVCNNLNGCSGTNTGIGVSYSYDLTLSTSSNYSRRIYWNNGSVNNSAQNACFSISYLTVN